MSHKYEEEINAHLIRATESINAAKELVQKSYYDFAASRKDLNWLFELRSVGDYGVIVHVGKDEAKESIVIAQKYLKAVKSLI